MIEKEFRALLPVWLATIIAMTGAQQLGSDYEFLRAPALVVGLAALGSLSFGHEYASRTIGVLLTLPIPRSRIWASKMIVLAGFVTSLAVLAVYVQTFGNASAAPLRVIALAGLAAIGLAPWLAMLSRSALGGAVFAASIPGTLFAAAQFIGLRLYGYTRTVDDFTASVMTVTVISSSALGLVLGWRTFSRLEAIEGRGTELTLFPSSGATPAVSRRRSHPVWLLIRKELRLQQVVWVLAPIFGALYFAIVVFKQGTSDLDNLLTLLILLYTAMTGILIGALAGGEERQLGVHDGQLLLPVSSLRQWVVKVASSLGLGTILTMLIPFILVTVFPPAAIHNFGRRGLPPPMLLPTLVTLGLYVSLLAGSGVRGLAASMPVGMTMFYIFMQFILPRILWINRAQRPVLPRYSEPYAIAVIYGLFLLVVLRLALVNYRWPDRSPVRLAGHAAIALAALTASFAVMTALGIR